MVWSKRFQFPEADWFRFANYNDYYPERGLVRGEETDMWDGSLPSSRSKEQAPVAGG